VSLAREKREIDKFYGFDDQNTPFDVRYEHELAKRSVSSLIYQQLCK